MFDLDSLSPTYWATVEAEVQQASGDRRTVRFQVQFVRNDASWAQQFARRTSEALVDPSADQIQVATDAIMEVARDFKDFTNKGEPVPFAREAVAQLVQAGLGPPILRAFYASLPTAKAKG